MHNVHFVNIVFINWNAKAKICIKSKVKSHFDEENISSYFLPLPSPIGSTAENYNVLFPLFLPTHVKKGNSQAAKYCNFNFLLNLMDLKTIHLPSSSHLRES